MVRFSCPALPLGLFCHDLNKPHANVSRASQQVTRDPHLDTQDRLLCSGCNGGKAWHQLQQLCDKDGDTGLLPASWTQSQDHVHGTGDRNAEAKLRHKFRFEVVKLNQMLRTERTAGLARQHRRTETMPKGRFGPGSPSQSPQRRRQHRRDMPQGAVLFTAAVPGEVKGEAGHRDRCGQGDEITRCGHHPGRQHGDHV